MGDKCSHSSSIVLESFAGFDVVQCTWACQEILIEVEVGNNTVVTIPVSRLSALVEVAEAAENYLSKRHHSNCGVTRFSDQENRRCTCGRDGLAQAIEKLKARGKVTA